MEVVVPKDVPPPASNYAHAVSIAAGARRVLVSGQVGVNPDGTVPEGCADQMRACWANVFGVLAGAGMNKRNIAKITVFLTDAGDVGLYRDIRDELLEGHVAASTLLVVTALASPAFKVEIEAEAVGD